MRKVLIAIIVSLAVGFAAASWIGAPEPDETPARAHESGTMTFDPSAPVEDRIRALEQAVADEREARQLLQDEVFFLTRELDQMMTAPQDVVVDDATAAAAEARRNRYSRRASGEQRVEGLIDAGFEPGLAQWIVQRESALQMEALRSRYEAQRSAESVMYYDSRMSASNALRDELGEAQYERYLAATGQPTRITISNVIESSPAHSAGLRPGDEILNYDGKRVYGMTDLMQQAIQGEPGQNVVVDIVRDGVHMQVVMPRGPLGVYGGR